MSRALFRVSGSVVSQFLTALSDLVNLGESGLAALQVLVAFMDVGLLGERRVVTTRPLAEIEIGTPACLLVTAAVLWVPKTYAARRYSWMTPPARSRRRTRK